MAGTDFFDEDLQNREAARGRDNLTGSLQLGAAGQLKRPVSDLNLTRMGRHRDEIDHQVATSAQELEHLRKRQEELERERRTLEELRKKQDEYERGRREISDRLNQSLIMMEKEQLKAEQLVEVLNSTRTEFKGMLNEISAISEDDWEDGEIRDELTKSIVLLDECRRQYNKSIARVDAMMAAERPDKGEAGVIYPGESSQGKMSFRTWLQAGFAFSLPLVVTLILLAGMVLLAWSPWAN
jgi:predicted ribosome quality control (RQC) complex YloA/Tae2 family protein